MIEILHVPRTAAKVTKSNRAKYHLPLARPTQSIICGLLRPMCHCLSASTDFRRQSGKIILNNPENEIVDYSYFFGPFAVRYQFVHPKKLKSMIYQISILNITYFYNDCSKQYNFWFIQSNQQTCHKQLRVQH